RQLVHADPRPAVRAAALPPHRLRRTSLRAPLRRTLFRVPAHRAEAAAVRPTPAMRPPRLSDRLVLPLVVLILTLASALAVNPYHYGDGDNSITIPFLRASLDPRLYPGDYMLAQRP